MPHTRDEVLAAAAATFEAGRLESVLSRLDLYGVLPHEPERERVQLAIIELSGGREDKLMQFIQIAKTDYRDVLAWKQLGPLAEAEAKKLRDEARALIGKWGGK